PTRVLDTRDGTGGYSQSMTAGQTIQLSVAPGKAAAVLNLTATNPTADSYLTVWPEGASQPAVSNLNFRAGQTIANRVMVKVGSTGKINIFNAAGRVDVIADLNGTFTGATGAASGGVFQGTVPKRILDTRNANGGITGPVGPGATVILPVAGTNGIPADATAVAANITITDPTAASYLTAWPDGPARPTVSDLNWVAGSTVPNLAIIKLGANGKLDLYNAAGSTDVIIDVTGWYR